jgi:type I restriction enzyme S subunit
MGNSLNELRLEDCMDAIIDYRGKTPKKTNSGIPLITAKIIKNGQIQEVKEFIAESDYESWMRRGTPEAGDVVLTTEAPLGEVAQLDDRKIALAQRVITLRGKKGLLDNDYLKYLLLSNDVQHQLDGRGTGTTVKGIKQSELREIILKFPDLSIQKSIAYILKTLDDKIELNRQTNQTLEQMAQTLFKSWFVDFDPVFDNALAAGSNVSDFPEALQQRALLRQERRKQAQQLAASPKTKSKPLPEDICNLFPNEFEQSDEPSIGINGWIPKGWQKGEFSDLIILQRGFDLPKSNRTDGLYPLIASSGQDGTHCESKVDGPGVVTGRSGKLGKVVFVKDNFWPLNTTLWVKKYLLSNPYHAYFYLQTLPLEEFNSGSAVPSLNRNHVHNVRCYLPPKGLTEAFKKCVCENFEKIDHNIKQIKHLEKLRDTLLPKLISGELTIPDSIKTENNVNHQQPKEPLYNHA